MMIVTKISIPLLVLNRKALRPSKALIQVVPIETLEGHESDSRIVEHLVSFSRAHDYTVLAKHRQAKSYKNNQDARYYSDKNLLFQK